MPRYGFSGDGPDMRKLILFALQAVGEAIDGRELTRLALLDENADYFLYSDALDALLGIGLLEREGEEYRLTPRGAEVSAVMGRGLPAALRRAVSDECAAVREQRMRGRCVAAEAVTEGDNTYFTGILTDGAAPLLELRLQTGGKKQAAVLKRRFEKDAETILQKIWELLTTE
jgi:hypothetical protein